MPNPVMYSTGSDEGTTPWPIFKMLDAQYGPFTLDAAASRSDAKVRHYYSKRRDSLTQLWTGKVWLNPPYGRQMGGWIEKCWRAVSEEGAEVVCALLACRTDTKWWHQWVWKATEVRLFRGRILFDNAQNPAPYPSCIVVWKRGQNGPPIFAPMEIPK